MQLRLLQKQNVLTFSAKQPTWKELLGKVGFFAIPTPFHEKGNGQIASVKQDKEIQLKISFIEEKKKLLEMIKRCTKPCFTIPLIRENTS